MPSYGTHITLIERLAASNPTFRAALGSHDQQATAEERKRMSFAKLGSLGPDIFYILAERTADMQEFQNFLVKLAGSFASLGEVIEEINSYITDKIDRVTGGVLGDLQRTCDLVLGILKTSIIAGLIDEGFSFFPYFEPQRQKDLPRETWWWAEMLHYLETGTFVTNLLNLGRDNPYLRAYGLGYMVHYITDVIGHSYVNQVVEAPARLHWQRHHLVENFIDAYIWDRWHSPAPLGEGRPRREQPMDRLTAAPNAIGAGAPFLYARLHQHINIGAPTLGDPVDAVVEAIVAKIRQGIFIFDEAEATEMPIPDDRDLRAWMELVADAVRMTYTGRHPLNLTRSLVGLERPEGYPIAEDIGAAYASMRLFLRLSTSETIREPQPPPPPTTSVSQAVQDLLDNLDENLSRLEGQTVHFDPPQDLEDLFKSLERTAKRLLEIAEEAIHTIVDLALDALAVLGAAAAEFLRPALYRIQLYLYGVYRSCRMTMMLNGYAAPFTDELLTAGPTDTSLLWRSLGVNGDLYPSEMLASQREWFATPPYRPAIPPRLQGAPVERDSVPYMAPFAPTDRESVGCVPTLPEDFIETPLGPDDFFAAAGPLPLPTPPLLRPNFGGALANSDRGLRLALEAFAAGRPVPAMPNYNMDSDRGYAWPCWDVMPPVEAAIWDVDEQKYRPEPSSDASKEAYTRLVAAPLDPFDYAERYAPGNQAQVQAEKL